MSSPRLSEIVSTLGTEARDVDVQISYDVVKLFSEQLYASPVKAIEELVVNGWDAGATQCSVLVALDGARPLIAVFDTGAGMTLSQMENLWHIGISEKSKIKSERKQIGKFGIGKLASYAVARTATYISKTIEGIHAVTIDFQAFANATDANGVAKPVRLTIRSIGSLGELTSAPAFSAAGDVLNTQPASISLSAVPTWTLVVLEDLKEKAHRLSAPRLRWVLETAMPLETDFQLYLNGEPVSSSKTKLRKVVQFTVGELEADRLSDLGAVTGETWSSSGGALVSPSFPSGIFGDVFVTDASLYAAGGKSEDLGRSHGFFVRVRNRLINETDPLFGARPLSFTTFYRFAAIVEAEDLNPYITASRDDVEQTHLKGKLRDLLIALFNQARDRFDIAETKKMSAGSPNKEGYRDYVGTALVERPLADALIAHSAEVANGTTSTNWKLVTPIVDTAELQKLVGALYDSERKDRQYSFKYSAAGALAPVARLDPATGTFSVNEDHPLVREFSEKPESKRLLEAVVVAEALLEVYLRAADVDPGVINDLLERRDGLLRGLALDETYSLASLANALRGAKSNAADLEIAVVGALRALGFGAEHIAGPGQPDGLAQYLIHGSGSLSFTLESKSSKDVPSLTTLDFAGLRSHYVSNGAKGCLLVAPEYQAAGDPNGEVNKRAALEGVSCWTIEQLSRVVEAAERRHLNARSIQDIVLNSFGPIAVTAAINRLLGTPTFDKGELYRAVISALIDLEPRLPGTPRDVSMIASEISRSSHFRSVDKPDVREAITDLARASSGMLHIAENDEVTVVGYLDELRRRVSSLTGDTPPPRRSGTFRSNGNTPK